VFYFNESLEQEQHPLYTKGEPGPSSQNASGQMSIQNILNTAAPSGPSAQLRAGPTEGPQTEDTQSYNKGRSGKDFA
jgi:hypothetical protein